jgi:hypothetical protein
MHLTAAWLGLSTCALLLYRVFATIFAEPPDEG